MSNLEERRQANKPSSALFLQRYNKLSFSDLDIVFDDLLHGEEKTALLSDKNVPILTFGSCFAIRLAEHLVKAGYSAQYMPIAELLNTPLFNLALIEAAVKSPQESEYGHLLNDQGGELPVELRPERVEAFRESLREAGIIVFTVGVGLLWRERKSGNVVLQPAKRRLEEYETFYPSPKDQSDFLEKIVRGVREVNREALIWLTLSPVPVETSLNYSSAVVSDCVSKSSLRVAIHQYMERCPEKVRYFPSFEFVRWISGHYPAPAFGDDGKVRHVNAAFVDVIVRKFIGLNGGEQSRAPITGRPDDMSCVRPSYNVAFYLPPVRSDDSVLLYMRHWADTLEKLGHRASFVETVDGKAAFHGKCSPDEVHFGVFLNSNFPAIKDKTTGEHIRQLSVGAFPHVGVFALPYHFDTVYIGATRAERLRAIFHFDPTSIPAVVGDQGPILEAIPPYVYSASPAPPREPQRKLLYVANIKGLDSLNQIFSRFPKVASQSRKLLEALSEDFSLSVPAIVSETLGMEYRDWVQQGEWRAYAEALQKTASLFDRLNTLRALSGFPCHYVLSAGKVPAGKFHPDSTFSGPIGFDRLLDLYDQHGGIVANLPSRIPNVLSERVTNAMAHGMIPIVPGKGDHLEYLNASNAIFYGEKVPSIREAITRFLEMEDSQRLAMVRKTYATAADNFSADVFVTRLVSAYEKFKDIE